MILFNEKLSDYLMLVGVLNGNDVRNGVSLRLLSLYMGLTFIATAVAIYALCSPKEIRGYSTAPEYIAAVQATMSDPAVREIEVALDAASEWDDEFEALRIVRRSDLNPDDGRYERGLLKIYFQHLDESREWWRFICILFYALGFAFVSMPSARVFVQITGIF